VNCSANVDFVAIVCFHAVIVGVSGDPRVARRRPYRAGLSAKYRGALSGAYNHRFF
jgi:Flp pilus assembly protein TadD